MRNTFYIRQRLARLPLLLGIVIVIVLLSLYSFAPVRAAWRTPAVAVAAVSVTNPTDGALATCDFVARDEASLQHAIDCVNLASDGAYTITVAAEIALTQPSTPITNPLLDQLVIAGNNHTIDAQDHGRVLDVQSVKQLTMRDLTLRGGQVVSDVNGIEYWGGGLRYYCGEGQSCTGVLSNVTLVNNQAVEGGGVALYCYVDTTCSATLINSVVVGNEAQAGGGITTGFDEENFAYSLQLINSVVEGNRAEEGGGIRLRGAAFAAINSTIRDNHATAGGGLAMIAGSYILRSTVVGSTISENVATLRGGGIYARSADPGDVNLTLTNSTISGNQVTESAGVGGGIAISATYGTKVDLRNSTLANNNAQSGAGIYFALEDDSFAPPTLVTLGNSLIAGNQTGSACTGVVWQDHGKGVQLFTSLGHNLDSDGACLTPEVRQPSDIPNSNANLGPLADNGGPTLTHALLPGSQAIDAADDVVCATEPVAGVDQRAVARPQGAHCDIGAYEVETGSTPQVVYQNDFTTTAGPDWSSTKLDSTPSGRQFLGAFGAEQVTLTLNKLPPHADVILIFDFYAIETWDGNQEFNHDYRVGPDVFDVAVAGGPTLLHTTFSNTEIGSLPGGASGPYLQAYPGAYPGGSYPPGTGASEIDTLGYPWDGDSVYRFSFPFAHTASALQVSLTAIGLDESERWGVDNVTVIVNAGSSQIFVSSTSSGSVGGIHFNDEDILHTDSVGNHWATVFDGSDVGITGDVDAFALLDDGSLLLSLDAPTTLAGVGEIDDSDIVRFIPTKLGSETAGAFEWYLDGSDLGLSDDAEDIDVIDFTPDGRLLVSPSGGFDANGVVGRDEDLFVLDNARFSQASSGVWRIYLDGSDVGVSSGRDINGTWVDPTNGDLYLSTNGAYSVTGVSGDQDDIFICAPTATGGDSACTFRPFWNGDQAGFGRERIDGIDIGALPAAFAPTLIVAAAAEATEAMDDEPWLEEPEEEASMLQRFFLPLVKQ